jgi:hypothetical protein
MRLLPQKTADTDDRRRAYPRPVVNLAIWKVGPVEQLRHMPSLRQRPNLGGGAQVKEQAAHFVAVASRQ